MKFAGRTCLPYAMLALQISRVSQLLRSSLPAVNRMSTVLDEAILEDPPEVDLSVLAASLQLEPERPLVLSFDIGTSGFRAQLFDGRGQQIESLIYTPSGDIFSEPGGGLDADADALLALVGNSLNHALMRLPMLVSSVDYVTGSCFWHSLLGVDDQGNAVTPVFGWAERRAANEVAELRAKFDERETHARTGCRFHPSYWPAKLLWLKKERPDLFRRARRWLSFSDYCSLKLFGAATTSVSMASATGLLNQKTCAWDEELLHELDLAVEQLPPIAEPGEVLQFQSNAPASRWPGLEGAVWFPAIGDGAANNIGSGCVGPSRTALMIGTSGAMRAVIAAEPPDAISPELFCYRAGRDRIVIGGALSDGGGLYQWMKQTLCGLYDDAEIEQSLAAIGADSHGLTVLPFWFGERSTGWAASAQGSITGLTVRTTPLEILRAAMEAVCYRFKLLATALSATTTLAEIVATGNALLSSPVWTQMIADVLGLRIEVSTIKESSCRGAALLALEAIGKIDNIETIEPEIGQTFEPDMKNHAIYASAIKRQQELYEKLIGNFKSQV
jgi:gluconokinase